MIWNRNKSQESYIFKSIYKNEEYHDTYFAAHPKDAAIVPLSLQKQLARSSSDKDLVGCSYFVILAAYGRESVLHCILQSNALHQADRKQLLPAALCHAVRRRHEYTCLMLLFNGADASIGYRDSTPLVEATKQGNNRLVSILLNHSANANGQLADGSSPLYIAASHGYEKVCKTLLAHGALVSLANNAGCSPLHEAVLKGNVDAVLVLLEADADPNDMRFNGTSPMHSAINNENWTLLKMLLRYGGNTSALGGKVKSMRNITKARELYQEYQAQEDKLLNARISSDHIVKAAVDALAKQFNLEGMQQNLARVKLEQYQVQTMFKAAYEEIVKYGYNQQKCLEELESLRRVVEAHGDILREHDAQIQHAYGQLKRAERKNKYIKMIFYHDIASDIYLMLCNKLISFFLACLCVSSGQVERKYETLEALFSGIADADQGLLSAMVGLFSPNAQSGIEVFQALLRIGTKGIAALLGYRHQTKINTVASVFYSLEAMQEIGEGLARLLIRRFLSLLETLVSKRGVLSTVNGVTRRLLAVLSTRDKINVKETMAPSLSSEADSDWSCPFDAIIEQLFFNICNVPIRTGVLSKHIGIDSHVKRLNLTDHDLFYCPGIELEDAHTGKGTGQKYIRRQDAPATQIANDGPDHFARSQELGFRLASKTELEAFKDILVPVTVSAQVPTAKTSKAAKYQDLQLTTRMEDLMLIADRLDTYYKVLGHRYEGASATFATEKRLRTTVLDKTRVRVKKMSIEEVATWVYMIDSDEQFKEYATSFKGEDIAGDALLALDEADLCDLGIESIGHRKRILVALEELLSAYPVYDTAMVQKARSMSMDAVRLKLLRMAGSNEAECDQFVEYSKRFEYHHIYGIALLKMDKDMLKALNVKIGHRCRIIEGIWT